VICAQVDEHNFTLGVGAKSTPAIAPHPEEVAVVEEEEEDPDADLFKKVKNISDFGILHHLLLHICVCIRSVFNQKENPQF